MDITTMTDAELADLAARVRAEQNRRSAQQQLDEDVRAAAERARALGLDEATVSAIASEALAVGGPA